MTSVSPATTQASTTSQARSEVPTQFSDPLELIEGAVRACLEGLEEDPERRDTYVQDLRHRLHQVHSERLH